MNVLSRELRGLLAQEPRALSLVSDNVERLSRAGKEPVPYLAWAERVMPRSSGWRLTFTDQSDWKPSTQLVYERLTTLSKLPFSELLVKSDYQPPYEPPYELRAKGATSHTVRSNGRIEQLIRNGLRRLTATNFDLDPDLLSIWADTTAKYATSLKLESVARIDSAK